jgi:fructosamine-3-kinase
MNFIPGSSAFSPAAEVHAADLLAELHEVSAPACGLDRDTLIGGLHQPNPWNPSWIAFFRDHRLLEMAKQAYDAAEMDSAMVHRIETFASRLSNLLDEPRHPSLLHGDVWSANVLADRGKITGFIDPAIYYGHPEIELAFITLFSTFGETFFGRYRERRGLSNDFFDARRDIYNLYPLLVHTRLFGGSYLAGVNGILARHGC